jgi:hypothetical protein
MSRSSIPRAYAQASIALPVNSGPWSVRIVFGRSRNRAAESSRYKFPPSSTANAGVRYTRRLFDRECSLRFDANNITNASGLTISPIYVVLPQLRRNYQLTAAIDF